MSEERQDWTQDGSFLDADGREVRAYDDVQLLRSVPQTAPGNASMDAIPAGTRATVLFFTSSEPVLLDLECYPSEGSFTFASERAGQVRLILRAEEKLSKRLAQ